MRRFALSLTILALISCGGNDNEMVSTQTSARENALFQSLDTSQLRHPIYLKGGFESWISKRGERVVFTETAQAKHLFVLQGIKDQRQAIRGRIKSLLFLDHCFILELANGNRLYFGVSKPEEKSIYNQVTRNNKSLTRIEYGFGLAHRWFGKEAPRYADLNVADLKNAGDLLSKFTNSSSVSATIYRTSSEDGGCGSCDSGGEGSTGCSSSTGSMGGCSISCQAGYYACCNSGFASSCKCCPSGIQ